MLLCDKQNPIFYCNTDGDVRKLKSSSKTILFIIIFTKEKQKYFGFSDVSRGNLIIQADFVLFLNTQNRMDTISFLKILPLNIKIKILYIKLVIQNIKLLTQSMYKPSTIFFFQLQLDLAYLNILRLTSVHNHVIGHSKCHMQDVSKCITIQSNDHTLPLCYFSHQVIKKIYKTFHFKFINCEITKLRYDRNVF